MSFNDFYFAFMVAFLEGASVEFSLYSKIFNFFSPICICAFLSLICWQKFPISEFISKKKMPISNGKSIFKYRIIQDLNKYILLQRFEYPNPPPLPPLRTRLTVPARPHKINVMDRRTNCKKIK